MTTTLLGRIDSSIPIKKSGPSTGAPGAILLGKRRYQRRKCVSTFLSVVGPSSYKFLRSLLALTIPSVKTFGQLVTVLINHYSPLPPELMQHFRFNSRTRQPGESVAAYMADLCWLAKHCKLGAPLNKMLRDRLMHGINDKRNRKGSNLRPGYLNCPTSGDC